MPHCCETGMTGWNWSLLLSVGLSVLSGLLPAQGQETSVTGRVRLLQDRYRGIVEENERLKEALEAARIELATLRQAMKRPEQAVKYRKAIDGLSEAIESRPEEALLFRNRGIAFRHVGEYAAAVRDLSQAIQLEASDARSFNERGTAYFLMRDLERARQDFSRAIALNGELGEAYHNRAVIYRGVGDYAAAVRDVRIAAKLGVRQAEQTLARLSAEVQSIQRRLDQLGFEAGPVDGIPGPKTVAAIRRFQREVGLEATGRVDIPTKAALRTWQRGLEPLSRITNPRLLTQPRVEYPAVARERGWQGTVKLRIELLANGRVGEVEVAQSSGYPVLDEAALRSVRGWRHRPATEDGVPVTRKIDFDVEFALDVTSE